jgi:DNA uptake protein ComE-like DNA-binding protein
VRRNLLIILVIGLVGTGAELLLLEHYEDPWQFAPFVLIGLALATLGWHAVSRGAASVRSLQAVMALCVLGGAAGVLLHYRGNAEFELEMYPEIRGFELFAHSITGATPALAPGTLALLGLIGLVYTQGHPQLNASRMERAHQEEGMGSVKRLALALAVAATAAGTVYGQPTDQAALIDPNKATEAELAKVPNITPEIAKAVAAERPFTSILDLDKLLAEHKLTEAQRKEVYGRMFVRINLNTASDEEIMKIPGMGKRMLHEFKEYRPYKSIEVFRREIGKYVSKDEVARFEKYVTLS